jgi:hypothetical protein
LRRTAVIDFDQIAVSAQLTTRGTPLTAAAGGKGPFFNCGKATKCGAMDEHAQPFARRARLLTVKRCIGQTICAPTISAKHERHGVVLR